MVIRLRDPNTGGFIIVTEYQLTSVDLALPLLLNFYLVMKFYY